MTLDGYVVPLQMRAGLAYLDMHLAYLDMHPPSHNELETLPHIVLTSDMDWDLSVLDNEFDLANDWDQVPEEEEPYINREFDDVGMYTKGEVNKLSIWNEVSRMITSGYHQEDF